MKEKRMKESTVWQIAAHAVMITGSVLAVFPFVLLVIASFTDNQTALMNGYSFFPEKWSLEAYSYIAREWMTVGRAYLMTIAVTVIGTVLSLVITSTFAFAVSNDKLPGHKILMFMSIFTMLFNGGIVASYYIYSNIFHIKNTIWALIVPSLLMSPFNVVLVKNYYQNSISSSILEAAQIDGASPIQRFKAITVPLISGAFTINFTLSLINGLKVFDQINVMTDGGPGFTSETLVYLLYKVGFNEGRQGFGTAVGIMLLFIIIVLNTIQQKFLRSREVQM